MKAKKSGAKSKAIPQTTITTPKKNILDTLFQYESLFKQAEKLYKEEEDNFVKQLQENDRDGKYYYSVLKKGTVSDKVNAFRMLIKGAEGRALGYI
jgi:hypothetical protein